VNDDDDDDFDEGASAKQEARAVRVASSSPLTIAAAAKPLSELSAHPSSEDEEACSTRALASRARVNGGINSTDPHGSQKEAKEKPQNENDDDDNAENRPIRVVDCDPSISLSSSIPEHCAASREEDDRRARSGQHPLSLVEQYVRSYALNLPSPSGKSHRKKAAGRTPPPMHPHHHQRSATRRGGGTPPTAGPSPSTSKWSGPPRSNITTASPARSERRRLLDDALSKAAAAASPASPASSSASSAAAAAAALTGGPWADSPRSHHPVMLRCLNAPSVTAAELWEQAHNDHRTTAATDPKSTAAPHHHHDVPTAASPRSHGSSSHGGTAAHFHEIDPATVALLGDRKRYRVDVDVDDSANEQSADDSRKETSAASMHVPPSSSSYSIRIVHELTGRVGTTIPVATLVAKATSPSHQLDRDDKEDACEEPSEKRRKVMPPPPFMGDDFAPEDPPGSCPLHTALSGVCSAVKKAKGAVLLLSPPRPVAAARTKTTAPTPATTEPELHRSERGRLV
jgi:hypothetical protein